MWWSRTLLLLALAGCGFTPVNAPDGALRGQVAVFAPDTRDDFLLVQRLEERLGRAGFPRYDLDVEVAVSAQGLAVDAEGDVRRFNLIGRADYTLRGIETGEIVLSGQVENFTGYSTTDTTVAALAAEQNARARLMTILADDVVLRLQAAVLSP